MKKYLPAITRLGILAFGLFALPSLFSLPTSLLQAQTTPSPQPSVTGMGKMGMMDDQQFIIMMIPHHQSAIAMADLALTRAQHPQIKQLAENIKVSQSQEIKEMQTWYQQWYKTAVPKFNGHGMGGMMHGKGNGMMHGKGGGMMSMETDLTALRKAKNFDQAFIEEMIPHHQMAVMMSQHLIPNSTHPEMKKLAEAIITAQNKEIKEMQEWYQKWYPAASNSR